VALSILRSLALRAPLEDLAFFPMVNLFALADDIEKIRTCDGRARCWHDGKIWHSLPMSNNGRLKNGVETAQLMCGSKQKAVTPQHVTANHEFYSTWSVFNYY
jgi:hypothetical protein